MGKVAVMRLYNIYYLCKMSIDGIKNLDYDRNSYAEWKI